MVVLDDEAVRPGETVVLLDVQETLPETIVFALSARVAGTAVVLLDVQ